MGAEAAGEIRALNGLLNDVYVALHTAVPTVGNEVVGGSYARQAYAYTLSGANPTQAANTAMIQFPTATADWGIIAYVGIWSASGGGSLLATGPLTVAKQITVDDVFRFLAGNLKVLCD